MRNTIRKKSLGFHPHMKSHIEDVSLLDDLHYRVWNGAIADVWSVNCGPAARGEYVSQAPRLFLVLESRGELTIGPEQTNHASVNAQPQQKLCYIPAGMTIWSHVTRPGKLKHLDLHFDIAALQQRFGYMLNKSSMEKPRLFFSSPKIEQIGSLLAEECLSKAPMHNLYGEGLLMALVAELFEAQLEQRTRNSKLSPRQLRRVTEFMEDNYARVIRLQELAALAGLSESYFAAPSRLRLAFRLTPGRCRNASTGPRYCSGNQVRHCRISQPSPVSPTRRISPVFSRNSPVSRLRLGSDSSSTRPGSSDIQRALYISQISFNWAK